MSQFRSLLHQYLQHHCNINATPSEQGAAKGVGREQGTGRRQQRAANGQKQARGKAPPKYGAWYHALCILFRIVSYMVRDNLAVGLGFEQRHAVTKYKNKISESLYTTVSSGRCWRWTELMPFLNSTGQRTVGGSSQRCAGVLTTGTTEYSGRQGVKGVAGLVFIPEYVLTKAVSWLITCIVYTQRIF